MSALKSWGGRWPDEGRALEGSRRLQDGLGGGGTKDDGDHAAGATARTAEVLRPGGIAGGFGAPSPTNEMFDDRRGSAHLSNIPELSCVGTVVAAVASPVCGSGGYRFKPGWSPNESRSLRRRCLGSGALGQIGADLIPGPTE